MEIYITPLIILLALVAFNYTGDIMNQSIKDAISSHKVFQLAIVFFMFYALVVHADADINVGFWNELAQAALMFLYFVLSTYTHGGFWLLIFAVAAIWLMFHFYQAEKKNSDETVENIKKVKFWLVITGVIVLIIGIIVHYFYSGKGILQFIGTEGCLQSILPKCIENCNILQGRADFDSSHSPEVGLSGYQSSTYPDKVVMDYASRPTLYNSKSNANLLSPRLTSRMGQPSVLAEMNM